MWRWEGGAEGLFSEISPDGRLAAYSVFLKGRMTGAVHVTDRRGHRVGELNSEVAASRFLYPVSWTPDGQVLLSDWADGGLYAWSLRAGTVTPLLLASEIGEALPPGASSPWLDAQFMSWSADGRYFAARVSWSMDRRQYRHGIVIGSPSGEILDLVRTREKHPNIPTWSPSRPELAFVDDSSLGSKAKLYVYDVRAGTRTLVMRNSPHPWWVAWSPRGDWLLLDTQGPWLFVSRDDGRVIERDRLGAFPRWASPGVDIHVPVC
jgi:WD40 repeat protein